MADNPRDYVEDAEAVVDAEDQHLRKIRKWRFANEGPAGTPLLGLALSGGGIRSAAFAMGVMHTLVRYDRLRWFDYLSTVSGGGYAGTALTWMLSTYEGADVASNTHTGGGAFPLSGWRQGVRGSVSNPQPTKEGKPLRRLDQIRQRAEYLTPGDIPRLKAARGRVMDTLKGSLAGNPEARWPLRLDLLSVIGVVLRGMVTGISLNFPVLILLMLVLGAVVDAVGPPPHVPQSVVFGPIHIECGEIECGLGPWAQVWGRAGMAMLSVFAAMALLYSALTRVTGEFAAVASVRFRVVAVLLNWIPPYPMRTYVQLVGGHLLRLAATFLLLASLPVTIALIGGPRLAAALTGTGAVGGVARLLLARMVGKGGRVPVNLVGIVAGVALCYGLLMLGYMIADRAIGFDGGGPPPFGLSGLWLALALVLWCGILGSLINANHVTPHRMYRDRLMEAFLVPALTPRAIFATENPERAKLADMCGCHPEWKDTEYPGPYHLINANVVLTGSRYENRRGRGGDNFVLSPLWCGSTATGWRRSALYGMPRWFENDRRTMTVASAMAISAAAANPNAAPGGRGVTRAWPIAFLMNFLGLRLGYSEVNPRRAPGGFQAFAEDYLLPSRPTGLWPGLPHLAGCALDERAHFVELTDGGHFENLGLYELLRRELPFIVCVDAVQDGDFAFADLANVIQRARVDFGAYIDFLPGFGLDEMTPPPTDAKAAAHVGTAVRGFALAEIRYAPNRPAVPPRNEPLEPEPGESQKSGVLIYVKSTLIAGLPADLYAYRAANPEFPHQTTADQFFDEAQFEAYRELGYRLASQALLDGTVQKLFATATWRAPGPLEATPPDAPRRPDSLQAILAEQRRLTRRRARAEAGANSRRD